jgi:uncharacterized protein (DUF433 family)
MAEVAPQEAWRRRLVLPHYQVQEAAKYADIDAGTVVRWQKEGAEQAVAQRQRRVALSFFQLVELAVVAALRKEGVPLRRIRDARQYFAKTFKSEFPFAEYRFKTDGEGLFNEYAEIVGQKHGRGKLIRPDQGGQLAWGPIIGRLKGFDYESQRKAVQRRVIRWHLGGEKSAVVIDPRLSFGAPVVKGVPTWTIRGRWEAGETPEEIASDFSLRKADVIDALLFEEIDRAELRKWLN